MRPGIALAILAKKKDSEDSDDIGNEKSISAMGADSAISKLFDAVKAGDKDAFKSAFKSAVSMCKDEDYDDESPADSEDKEE